MIILPADFDKRVAGFFHLGHHHGVRDRLFQFLLRLAQVRHLLLGTGKLRCLCLPEKLLQLRLLLGRPLFHGHLHQCERRCAAQRCHIARLKRPGVDAEIIHTPSELRAGGTTPSDAEGLGRFDGFCQRINHNVGLFKLTIYIHLHAGSPAGAIVGHCEMQKRIRW